MNRNRPDPRDHDTGATPSGPVPPSQPRRRRRYFVMMGVCVVLFLLAGLAYRWSVPLGIAMTVVAMAIPPFAAIVANRRERGDRWWDE